MGICSCKAHKRNGSGDGQFVQPYGIAVDSSGYIYVADRYNNRIQKFPTAQENTLANLCPDAGYWINVNQAATWSGW